MRAHEFNLNPSRRFLLLLTIVFVLSGGVLLSLPLHPILKGIGSLLLVAYYAYGTIRYGLLLSRLSILSLRFAQGRWRVSTKQAVHLARLCRESTATGKAMVLRFRVEGHFFKQSCLVMTDSLSASQYRELLVLLKMRGGH